MDARPAPDYVSLTLEDGVLVGSSPAGALETGVAVSVDGRHWATVPSRPVPGSGGRTFRCALPPVPEGAVGTGTAVVSDVFGDPPSPSRVAATARTATA